jgi:hypothetical protein
MSGVPETHELKENERWWGAAKDAKDGKRTIELVTEPGVSNEYKMRDAMNVIFFTELEASIPPWPRKWDRPVASTKKVGFGI